MSLALSALLRVVLFVIGSAGTFLPRGVELWLGPRLGRLMLRLGLFKCKVAAENIRNCFPEMDDAQRRRLLERNFEHYGILFFEYLHFFSPVSGHYRSYMERHAVLEGRENWKRAHDRGRGVLFVASHVGFWESLAAAGAMSGMPLTIVTTVLKPPWLNEKIAAQRLSTGVRAANHPGAAKTVLKALREKGSVAFMNDQYAPPPMGVPVRFFGVEVATLSAVGLLAGKTGAAVVPVGAYRDDDGVSHVVIQPEMEFDGALKDPAKVTQALASEVERWVRLHPEQWLWIHRRFKGVTWPAGRDPLRG